MELIKTIKQQRTSCVYVYRVMKLAYEKEAFSKDFSLMMPTLIAALLAVNPIITVVVICSRFMFMFPMTVSSLFKLNKIY